MSETLSDRYPETTAPSNPPMLYKIIKNPPNFI